MAKVFERIIYDQIFHYLTVKSPLSSFRSLHSTVTALNEATDSWSLNIDRGCFLEFKESFQHCKPRYSSFQIIGIQAPANQWFWSYLKNRSGSSERFLLCGVPQGTILGPLILIIHNK